MPIISQIKTFLAKYFSLPLYPLPFTLLSLVLTITPAFANLSIIQEKTIASGLGYAKYVERFSNGYSVPIHVLTADLNSPFLKVKLALAKGSVGRLQTVSSIAFKNKAISAVNGTFFDRSWPYLPIGVIVIDGNFITKSSLNRSAVGFTKDNNVKFGIPKFLGNVSNLETKERIAIWGINRPRKENEVIIYTPEFGWRTKTNNFGIEAVVENDIVTEICMGNSDIPRDGYAISFHGWTKNYANQLPPGAKIEANIRLSEGWENFDQVITGGPRLLDGGKIVTSKSIRRENFRGSLLLRNARTALGFTNKKKLIIAVSEGKIIRKRYKKHKKYRIRKIRTGLTFTELANAMKELGCRDAIALDGGGASTMYVKGKIVNFPSDGYQQSVSNAVIIKIKK